MHMLTNTYTQARREKTELRKKESCISETDKQEEEEKFYAYKILDYYYYYYSVQFPGNLLVCFARICIISLLKIASITAGVIKY